MALEYFYFPTIRLALRKWLEERVSLNTEPTDRGSNLTVYDYYYPVKHIVQKQLTTRCLELWMLALEAEHKGLIKLSFSYGNPQERRSTDIEGRLTSLFLQNTSNKELDKESAAYMWDCVRTEIISKLVRFHAIPDFE